MGINLSAPFMSTSEEFRKILKEYGKVLVVKFKAEAEADEEVGRSLLKNLYASDISPENKDRTNSFWEAWGEDKRRLLLKMLELEKTAFNRGYILALALTPGSCALCSKCNVQGTCTNPSMARYPEHALGINLKKP